MKFAVVGFDGLQKKFLDSIFRKTAKELKVTDTSASVLVRPLDTKTQETARVTPSVDNSMFLMEIKPKIPLWMQGIAICHELVHIEQSLSGRFLVGPNEQYLFFEGRPYSTEEFTFNGANHQDYMKFPWEKEAWEKQGPLFGQYLSNCLDRKILDAVHSSMAGFDAYVPPEVKVSIEKQKRNMNYVCGDV